MSFDEFPEPIPGSARIRELSKEYRDPTMVNSPKLLDVSFIQDPGMRAVVVLALSLEWNMVHKANRVLTLIARNGFKQVIPTDTSIKFSVFQNRVYATITHSTTHIPTPELMEKIIKQHKLGPSHARVFRDAVAKLARIVVIEPEAEAATTPVVDEFVPTERVEPTLSTAAKGLQYVSQIMETVIRQLVPDGEDQITYRCMVCGLEFPTKRGVGGHYGGHVTRGEAEAKPEARDNAVKVTPTPVSEPPGEYEAVIESIVAVPEVVPMRIEQGHIESGELTRLRQVVDRIAELVGREHIEQLQERCQELTIERDAAVTRAERLASDLRTLRELIGGLSSE